MKHIIFLIKVIAIVLFTCYGCINSKPISGLITDVKGQKVKCSGKWFEVKGTPPQVGQRVVFQPTKDTSKVNSIIIKP